MVQNKCKYQHCINVAINVSTVAGILKGEISLKLKSTLMFHYGISVTIAVRFPYMLISHSGTQQFWWEFTSYILLLSYSFHSSVSLFPLSFSLPFLRIKCFLRYPCNSRISFLFAFLSFSFVLCIYTVSIILSIIPLI